MIVYIHVEIVYFILNPPLWFSYLPPGAALHRDGEGAGRWRPLSERYSDGRGEHRGR